MENEKRRKSDGLWGKVKNNLALYLVLVNIITWLVIYFINGFKVDLEKNAIAHTVIFDRMKTVELNASSIIEDFKEFKKEDTEFKKEFVKQLRELVGRLDRAGLK